MINLLKALHNAATGNRFRKPTPLSVYYSVTHDGEQFGITDGFEFKPVWIVGESVVLDDTKYRARTPMVEDWDLIHEYCDGLNASEALANIVRGRHA